MLIFKDVLWAHLSILDALNALRYFMEIMYDPDFHQSIHPF